MQIYMIPITAGDSSAGSIENEMPHGVSARKVVEIGDLLLGIVSLTGGPGNSWGPGRDFSDAFASIVTESATQPGVPVIIQNTIVMNGSGQNFNGTQMLALMQRGEDIPATASITVGPVDLRT